MTEENPAVSQEPTTDAVKEPEAEEKDAAEKLKEAIEVETEDIGTLRKKITITIPRETIDERLGDQFSELRRDAVVPGFRKGHAPLRLVEKRFGNDVGEQLVSELVGGSFLAAVDKVDIKPLGDPLIWVDAPEDAGRKSGGPSVRKLMEVDKALPHIKLPAEGPMTISCEVELRPEFELPSLDGIPINKPTVAITDADVDSEIDRLRSAHGNLVPVEDAVSADDLIVADLTMTVDRKVVKQEKNVTLAARPQRIEGVAVENLGEVLIGKKTGDTVKVQATIGDDHENEDFRGKTVEFELLIHDVKRLQLPPIDKDFLESIGFETKAELKQDVRTGLEARLDSVIRRGMRGQIGKYMIENTSLEIPAGLSQNQTDRLVSKRLVEMYQVGFSQADIDKQIDELRARVGEEVTNELKLFFVMEKIAEKMEIQVGDDEINGAIAMIARQQRKRFDRMRDELRKTGGLNALFLQLRDDRILDELLAKAVVTEVEGPKTKKAKSTPKTKKPAAKASKPMAKAAPKAKSAPKAKKPTTEKKTKQSR